MSAPSTPSPYFGNPHRALATGTRLIRQVITWEAQPADPAPFSLLRLPFEGYIYVRERCALWRTGQ